MGESLYWKVEMKFPPPQSSPLLPPNYDDDHDHHHGDGPSGGDRDRDDDVDDML